MTGVETLAARTVLGCAGAAATVGLPRVRGLFTCGDRVFRATYLVLFSAVRLLLFSLVFLVMHIAPRGDLPGIYILELRAHLAGGVPYRDYASSYAPLFPYLYGPIYRWHPSALTLILFSIAMESVTAAIFLRFMPRVLPEAQVRLAALLCLVNPISLQFVTIDGQNNVVIGLFLALALLWCTEQGAVLSGASLGAAIAAVKFLPLLFVPVFPFFLRRRVAWFAGLLVVLVAVHGGFALLLHAPVLQAFLREGHIKSAGGLPYLVEAATGRDFGRTGWDVLLAGTLLAVVGYGWRLSTRARVERARLAAVTYLLPALLLTVMALGKKTWPTYTEMVLFPVAMATAAGSAGRQRAGTGTSAAAGPAVWAFVIFSLLSVTVHSIWASVLGQASAAQLHRLLHTRDAVAWGFLLLEAALLVSYAEVVWLCLSRAGRMQGRAG